LIEMTGGVVPLVDVETAALLDEVVVGEVRVVVAWVLVVVGSHVDVGGSHVEVGGVFVEVVLGGGGSVVDVGVGFG